jgi:ubiquinone/menaquinone biosynthesis C-methylase UbiE
MSNKALNTEQGHWILAKMGKKVLRPGGKELTLELINSLRIQRTDDVVEFAPGLGYTASVALQKQPKTYTGVELNESAASLLRGIINGEDRKIIVGNAANSTLKENSADKVYGEAMLTMQADHRKSEIIREAHRILKKGGLYGIHELGLYPDGLNEEIKLDIQKQLGHTIKVTARPMTQSEWTSLLEKEGFKIVKVVSNAMSLLEFKRVIDDEGIFSTIKIVFNILTHPKERKRILAMRNTFRKYNQHMNAIAIIAKKQ